jgi:putative endonuclease
VPVVSNAASIDDSSRRAARHGGAERCPTIDTRRALGRLGEDLAAGHFGRLGFRVIARNVRTRSGEIDLIACDGSTLVFAEVKARRGGPDARRVHPDREPLAGLRPRQRNRIRQLAVVWLSEERDRPRASTIRFDAVGVIVDARGRLLRLDHIEAAW